MKKIITLFMVAISIVANAQSLFLNDIYTDAQIGNGVKNVQCGTGPHNVCDVYAVAAGAYHFGTRPLLIIAPGSGFVNNGLFPKDNVFIVQAAKFYAKKGYFVVVIDYQRYGTFAGVTNPNQVWYRAAQDVYAAINYWTTPVVSIPHRISPNHVYILGQSAGGIGASHVAFNTPAQIENEVGTSITNQFGKLDHKTLAAAKNSQYTIRGMAFEASGIPNLNLFNLANQSTGPKIMTLHSKLDNSVPYNESLKTIEYPKNSGHTISLHLRGGGWLNSNYNCSRHFYYRSLVGHNIRTGDNDGDGIPETYPDGAVDSYFVNFFYQVIWNPSSCPNETLDLNTFWGIGKKETTTGTKTTVQKVNTSVYPNPFKDEFTIAIDDAASKQYTIKVTDLQGRVIVQTTLTQNQQKISMLNQKAGTYIVQVFNKTKLVSRKLVVKTK